MTETPIEVNFKRNTQTGKLEFDLSELVLNDQETYERFLNTPEQVIAEMKQEKSFLFDSNELIIKDMPPSSTFKLSELRSKHLNTLVKVSGILKKVIQPTSKVESVLFECSNCGQRIQIQQKGVKLIVPLRCRCDNRNFNVITEHLTDIQEMEIEENMEEIGSKQPHKMRILLEGHLTDPNFSKFQVGNKVDIVGIFKKMPAYVSGKEGERTILDHIIKVINIIPREGYEEDLHVSADEEKRIREIALGNPLHTLANSLAPNIYGLDHIKKAAVLFATKGVGIDNGHDKRRGNIHMLVIGDAGLGKSSIIQNMQRKLHNCRVADGKDASKAGIVATVTRDQTSGKWSLEAGDIVLANNGYLIIDEADKLPQSDRQALHGPMESGMAIISKAGIHANLQANTSIFAVANPKMGKFDAEKSIIEQIDFGPTLLSRFDLIYILKDNPDKDADTMLADVILGAHSKKVVSELSPEFLKKYIMYASRLKPILTPHAAKKIKEIYAQMRGLSERDGKFIGTPITARHLEGLIRLSQAHAKLRLCDTIELMDVDVAEGLFKHSLSDFGVNSDGTADLSSLNTRVRSSKKDKYFKIVEYLKGRAKACNNHFKKRDIYPDVQRFMNMSYGEVDEMFAMLYKEGETYEPNVGEVSLVRID
jgi:replicative DNA helicase Mcm